jgi:hypothetical protein
MRTTSLEVIIDGFAEVSRERNGDIGLQVSWGMKNIRDRVYSNLQEEAAITFNLSEFEPTGTSEEKFLTLYKGLYWIYLASGSRNGTDPYVQLFKLWRLYDRNLQDAIAWSDNLLSIYGARRLYTLMIDNVNRGQQGKITMD